MAYAREAGLPRLGDSDDTRSKIGGITGEMATVLGAPNRPVGAGAPMTAHDHERDADESPEALEGIDERGPRPRSAVRPAVGELRRSEVRRDVTHDAHHLVTDDHGRLELAGARS